MDRWPWRSISNDPPWQRRVDRGVGIPQGCIRGTGSQITPTVLHELFCFTNLTIWTPADYVTSSQIHKSLFVIHRDINDSI